MCQSCNIELGTRITEAARLSTITGHTGSENNAIRTKDFYLVPADI
jgi:hypothetical protein